MRHSIWLLRCAAVVAGLCLVTQAAATQALAQGSPYGPWWATFPDDPMGDSNPHNYYEGRGYYAPYALGASGGYNIFPYYGTGWYGAPANSPYRPGYFAPQAYAPYLYGHLGGGCDYHCGVGWW
jgi:hypothetical protein